MSNVDPEASGRYSFTAPPMDRARTRRRVIARGSAPPRTEPSLDAAEPPSISLRPTREVHVTGLFELLNPEDPEAVTHITATSLAYESFVVDVGPADVGDAVTGRLPLFSATRDWPNGFVSAPVPEADQYGAATRSFARGFVLGTMTGIVAATGIAVVLSILAG